MDKVLNVLKELAPYLVSIVTAIIAYKQATKGFKNELDKLEKEHENEIETLVAQHTVDIDNLKQKHIMEMESKEKDYQHEIEMQKLKSESAINEKNQEFMGNAMSSLVGNVIQDVISGKTKIEDLQKFSNQFPKKQ